MTHKKKRTSRGFALYEFKDANGQGCTLQKSSAAQQDLIWLGCDDIPPKIMASQAAKHGVETKETTGWIDYPLPEGCLLTSRMHLSKKQAIWLLPKLIKFILRGEV